MIAPAPFLGSPDQAEHHRLSGWSATANSPGGTRGGSGTAVFVASSGGHLSQLRLIAERVPSRGERRIWVSYDNVSARSTLADEEMVIGFGPSTRSLTNAVRNLGLAREIYDAVSPDLVVSTGAGIAVPFLSLAATRGIEARYIESATRTDGPSLTGRILERTARHVDLYAQYGGWLRGRWQQCENVFDEFTVVRDGGPGATDGLRILVTVGSRADFPFPALIDRISRLVRSDDRVIWQIGSSPAPPVHRGHEVTDFMSYERMTGLLEEVDVVISHAGVGVTLSTLMAGRRPLLVPRRAARGEVVDDHQVSLGAELRSRRLALVREVDDLRREDILEAASYAVRKRPPTREVTETIVGGATLDWSALGAAL